MEQLKNLDYPSNALGRFWMKIPLIVRAILLGFCVSTLGIGVWTVMATAIPVHWAVVLMGPILILFWLYFSGKWKPTSTQSFRRFCMRETKLKKSVWVWGMLGALTIIVILQSGLSLTFRLYEFQPDTFKTARFLNDFPAWTAWPLILMASLVAGICEEVGYRGYMQKAMEQKYGPVVSISITSVIFVIVHLHQAWASGVLLGIFGVSVILGYLAYSTNSLIPGIIAHASFDVINFSYWWSDVIGNFDYKPISMTGVDNHFMLTLMVVILSSVGFILSIRKLLKLKASNSKGF